MTASPRPFRVMRNTAALSASGNLNLRTMNDERPREVPFLFATFSLGMQRKSRRKKLNSLKR